MLGNPITEAALTHVAENRPMLTHKPMLCPPATKSDKDFDFLYPMWPNHVSNTKYPIIITA
jgi:hypothetical protein